MIARVIVSFSVLVLGFSNSRDDHCDCDWDCLSALDSDILLHHRTGSSYSSYFSPSFYELPL